MTTYLCKKLRKMNKQQTVQTLLFSKKAEKKTSAPNSSSLQSPDPKVQTFYNQLTPQQVVAHSIAVTHLGTSYDVTRTHGYTTWLKTQPK